MERIHKKTQMRFARFRPLRTKTLFMLPSRPSGQGRPLAAGAGGNIKVNSI